MCGICGIYDYGNTTPAFDESLLVAMSDEIRHRGPDDQGIFVSRDRRAGLGFRRLAIVDLSQAGHQPMSTPDGSLTIIFNGEIYNHQVLRREFEGKGYRYRSRTDTESILYAYKEYGLEFVHKLLGMFAIALWDDGTKELVLVRDRIGVKPLYYTVVNGQVVFGSEIKAILKHPSVSRELNEEGMAHYLTFLITPPTMTMFAGIRKLEAGHRLVVRADGILRDEQYWTPVPRVPQPSIDLEGNPVGVSPLLGHSAVASEGDHIRTIRSLLEQSVKDRMMSDVPFGVFLSGGIDSSTNTALMAGLMDRPVDTFSVGFRDLEQYNELQYARQIADKFGTNHHEIIIEQKDAFDFLPKLIHHQDEPLADPVCIPLYFISKLARENGTIVVQIGEGSDELFAGYPWMVRELRFYRTLWKYFHALPSFLRKAVYHGAKNILAPQNRFLILDYIRKGAEGDELFWGGAISFTETHKRHLLGNGLQGHKTQELAKQWHREILANDPDADFLKRMIYLEFRSRLPELLLMRVDKITMATSVEGRDPFLDHRLVEYAMTIPSHFKIRNGETKYILKKAVAGLIPDEIIHRRKQGFAAPVNEWLRTDWGSFVREKLLGSSLIKRGLFRPDYVGGLIERHASRKQEAGGHLWTLLNLFLWYEYWIEGKNI
ncbi:MAG TPA: asparagine synthase (glutamine-hydrolyzing) [Bacteroidota bacterium]